MVETSEISVQTDDKYKTPLYVRECARRYRETNKDKEVIRKLKYRRQKIESRDEAYYRKSKEYNKRRYIKKKENGITPEEKAKKAAYMKEYRARKKLERQNLNAQ